MPTYIMLSTLTPEGVQTVRNNPARIRAVNNEIEQLGATVKAQWATLGRFDFINVVEAPDEATDGSTEAADEAADEAHADRGGPHLSRPPAGNRRRAGSGCWCARRAYRPWHAGSRCRRR